MKSRGIRSRTLMCALLLLGQQAQAADATRPIAALVQESDHILVGRIVSTELVSATVGTATRDCGVAATVRVMDNVIGKAAPMIQVAFSAGPAAGTYYFLPLKKSAPASSIGSHTSDHERALQACRAKLPTLIANEDDMAAISPIRISIDGQDQGMTLDWLEKPAGLWIPQLTPTQVYEGVGPPTPDDEMAAALMPAVLRDGAEVVRWYEFRQLFDAFLPK